MNCHNELSSNQRMYSSGLCPLCGYKHRDAGTIVYTYEKAYRNIRIAPFWMFWKRQHKREYLDDALQIEEKSNANGLY